MTGPNPQRLIELTPEQVDRLHWSRRKIADLLPELDHAAACGIETSGYRAVCQGIDGKASALLEHFASQESLLPPNQS